MPRRIAAVAAWVLITALSILVASAAVGSVRSNVSDTPSPLRAIGVTSSVGAQGLSEPTSSSTTFPAPTTTASTISPEPTTTTTSTNAPGTTVAPPTTSTTTAPSPSTTTTRPPTTTTTAAEATVSTHPQIGGTTTIRREAVVVSLVAAVPNAGFQVTVEDSGPDSVRVEYRSDSHKSTFKAEWEDGQWEIDTEESGEDDD